MICRLCGKPIVLDPLAVERSRKSGNPPHFYTNLFTSHSECFVEKRSRDSVELMRRLNSSTLSTYPEMPT